MNEIVHMQEKPKYSVLPSYIFALITGGVGDAAIGDIINHDDRYVAINSTLTLLGLGMTYYTYKLSKGENILERSYRNRRLEKGRKI